jgi:hypothetical protein
MIISCVMAHHMRRELSPGNDARHLSRFVPDRIGRRGALVSSIHDPVLFDPLTP